MSEVFPISCLACRRLKIKCNRVKPCKQCERKNTVCEFPSTFRNAAVRSERQDPSVTEELESLKKKYEKLSNYSSELEITNKKLTIQLQKSQNEDINSNTNQNYKSSLNYNEKTITRYNSVEDIKGNFSNDKAIVISGETTEEGEKYYGPSSSAYMIDSLKKNEVISSSGALSAEFASPNEELPPNDIKSNITLNEHHKSENDKSESKKSNEMQGTSKKDLPCFTKNREQNIFIIKSLVTLFFRQNVYYRTFINQKDVMEFLTSFKYINDDDWEHDDDLLLLYMILSLSVLRATPKTLADLGIISSGLYRKSFKIKKQIVKHLLYPSFEELRHNLLNESISTIQSYILCVELYMIEQRYEESWSMMFHTTSIAYAIGLHAMRKIRFQNVFSHNNSNSLTKETRHSSSSSLAQDDEEDKVRDIERFKVWFALKNISGQICSTLGRPNPISIQVNSNILKSIDFTELKEIDYNELKVKFLLKSGQSECLRLSNMMLIENFMVDFTFQNVLDLNNVFELETKQLEWFYENRDKELISSINKPVVRNSSDAIDDSSVQLDVTNLLLDLITLYVNRAKLLEAFLNSFSDEQAGTQISEILKNSIMKFLDYIVVLVDVFLDHYPDIFSELQEAGAVGKFFRYHYPCLCSFVYQGVIVIFTFLHYRYTEFVNVQSKNIENAYIGDFLNVLEQKLNSLKRINRKSESIEIFNLWPSNIKLLIDKILRHIQSINKKRINSERDILRNELDNFSKSFGDSELDEFFGFNINDPFWLRNPGNFPYYLTSPSEDTVSATTDGSPCTQNKPKSRSSNQSDYHTNLSADRPYGLDSRSVTDKQSSLSEQTSIQSQPEPNDIQYVQADYELSYNPNTSTGPLVREGLYEESNVVGSIGNTCPPYDQKYSYTNPEYIDPSTSHQLPNQHVQHQVQNLPSITQSHQHPPYHQQKPGLGNSSQHLVQQPPMSHQDGLLLRPQLLHQSTPNVTNDGVHSHLQNQGQMSQSQFPLQLLSIDSSSDASQSIHSSSSYQDDSWVDNKRSKR